MARKPRLARVKKCRLVLAGAVIAFLCETGPIVFAAGGRRPIGANSELTLEHVSRRCLDESDAGSLQIFLRNDSPSTRLITRIVVNDVPLPTWCVQPDPNRPAANKAARDDRIVWARLLANPIPPGGETEVFLKWAYRRTKKVRWAIDTAEGKSLQTVVPPLREEPLRLMAIRVAPDLRRVCLYVKNVGKENLSVKRVFLNGTETTGQTRIGARTLLSSNTPRAKTLRRIDPGQTKCLVVRCEEPWAGGDLVFAKVVADGGADEGWARVIAHFPFGEEFTQQRFSAKYPPPVGKAHGNETDPVRFIQLAHCLTHRPAQLTWSERARAVLAADRHCREVVPRTPTLIHLCKAMLKEGLLTFRAVCDTVLTNTNESEVRTSKEDANGSETATQRLSRFASSACAPRPWFQIVMLESDTRFPEFRDRSPNGPETRARIYWALSAGCQGFCLRGRPGPSDSGLRNALREVETEFRQVRDLLACTYPIGQGESSDPKVEVCVLQSGLDALLLLVINHDFRYLPGVDVGRIATWRIKQDLTLHVPIPAGFAPGEAFWVHGSKEEPLRLRARDSQAVIFLPRVRQVECVLLRPAISPPGK